MGLAILKSNVIFSHAIPVTGIFKLLKRKLLEIAIKGKKEERSTATPTALIVRES